MEMQEKQAAIQAKAEELKIKQQEHELDKAKLLLEAQKIQSANELNVFDHKINLEKARVTHDLDHEKSNKDFHSKIATILADVYKHNNPQKEHKSSP
jgi:hypothetical protein